jgi:hypothetical protein
LIATPLQKQSKGIRKGCQKRRESNSYKNEQEKKSKNSSPTKISAFKALKNVINQPLRKLSLTN